ncbi:hypothetical protein NDU88_001738 [Pleurodeles waltl]|uniref:Uncharacterized protein n=1 Tax=Pleurodeles waltl TaxID=8319 RepID=A0AAV7WN86_PLEWA|nr:hypothetical protein NDU88_001738 [Pleurodeles waltl]
MCSREAGPCENDDSKKNLDPQEPFPGGTVKNITSVCMEERADVRNPEERDTGKWSRKLEKNINWRRKEKRDGVDRSKKRADGNLSTGERVSKDPRNEVKDQLR